MKTQCTGIFWDYENMPLTGTNWKKFSKALTHYVNYHQNSYIRVFLRRNSPYSHHDLILLHRIPKLRIVWTERTGKNAVDKALIDSCRNHLRTEPSLSNIFLITCDGDFKGFITELRNRGVTVTVISIGSKCNKKMREKVDRSLSIEQIIGSEWWWK